jgi:hypothetical protein
MAYGWFVGVFRHGVDGGRQCCSVERGCRVVRGIGEVLEADQLLLWTDSYLRLLFLSTSGLCAKRVLRGFSNALILSAFQNCA